MINRRHIIQVLGGASLVAASAMPSFAVGGGGTEKRLVVVFLRGAMDGLHAVPAYGDPDYERARAGIAMAPVGAEKGGQKLDGFFGLHPLLPTLGGFYKSGQMLAVHAIASPYRERSHFDGQNLVENGSTRPYGLPSGWLNRALVDLPDPGHDLGIAIATAMPVIMRGKARTANWSPSSLNPPSPDIVQRVAKLYAPDPVLTASFEKARAANTMMAGEGEGGQQFPVLMRAAATFLKDPKGPRVAFVASGGWDTHSGQTADSQRARRRLARYSRPDRDRVRPDGRTKRLRRNRPRDGRRRIPGGRRGKRRAGDS
jgi:uncharacterized protein (DUF1501 family)